MGLEAAGESDDGFQRDAGDRPVGRGGHLEPRQLRFLLQEAGFLGLAINRGRGTAGNGAGESKERQSGTHTRPRRNPQNYSAATRARRVVSILSMASTTASNVSKVEAWRAL